MEKRYSYMLIGICLFCFGAINFPFIKLVNKPLLIGSIPLFYAYIFALWLILIAFLFWITQKQR